MNQMNSKSGKKVIQEIQIFTKMCITMISSASQLMLIMFVPIMRVNFDSELISTDVRQINIRVNNAYPLK